MWPQRFCQQELARRRFGARVERLGDLLCEGDPLADAAVMSIAHLPRPERQALVSQAAAGRVTGFAALDALVTHASRMPLWFDPERATRGGAVLRRSGAIGGVVLGFKALLTSYCSPAGNKPLMFTARLEKETQRRLGETARFVESVCLPGTVQPGSVGHAASLEVRLVHAEVRRALSNSSRWDAAQWGVPINQADMSGTVLLFSLVLADGLTQLGMGPNADELGDLLHLWRGVGWLMGVVPELLCATEHEARSLWEMILATQGPPDEDSRKLARALIELPPPDGAIDLSGPRGRWIREARHLLARHFVGDALADGLGLPRTPWSVAMPALAGVVGAADAVVRRVPLARAAAEEAGAMYWRKIIEEAVGVDARGYPLPHEP